MNFLIGLATALVSAVFAGLVLTRYFQRGGTHLLVWGLGLLLYFVGGATEVWLTFGWSELAFRLWYWSGAIMVAAVLGQGSMFLLVRKPYISTICSVVIGVIALISLVWIFSLPLDATRFQPNGDVGAFLTDSYKNILPQSIIRRTLPPIMNAYGTLLLVGGAIQSAMLFFRKQILPNRVLGNVFIALGGLLPAAAGSIVKLAETTPELSTLGSTLKYLAIFAGVLILFVGFQLATAGASQPKAKPVPA